MAVRPEIALAVQRPKLLGPSEVMSLRDLAQQGELRRMKMEELEAARETRNALKGIYGQQGAFDPKTGLASPETISRVGTVDPATAADLQTKRLTSLKTIAETEAAEARRASSEVEIVGRKQDLLNRLVRGPALAAYEAALPQGQEAAVRAGQEAYTKGIDAVARSGVFSVEEKGQFAMDFDPMRVRQRLIQSKEFMDARKAALPQRTERIAGETLIQEERDPVTGQVREVGRGPRFSTKPLVNVDVKERDKTFDKEDKLRADYKAEPTVKAASEMDSAFRLIETAFKSPSAANDLAMATKYMKVLDPTSVVRESEFALAVSATGLLDKVRNYAAAVLEGKKLNPQQRKDFYESAKAINEAFQKGREEIDAQYSEMATGYDLNPRNVIPGLRKKNRIKFSDLPD